MVPRIGDRGHSFKGAGLYFLHDKQADTKERVQWTYIHNIPTKDPDKAFKWMAYTAMNADMLKRQSGVKATGRKATKGPVYTFSLAWAPHQQPDKQTMLESAFTTLGLLDLEDHEAVFVAHNDTAHPHVHVICNLVHPETGKTKVVSYDRLTMSQWAEGVERSDGEILCEQRVVNNEQRRLNRDYNKMFGMVKHRERKLEIAQHIQQLYEQSDSGKAFQSALEHSGYTLAKGDRRGFVLVDKAGEIYSLSRQLKGHRANDIKTRLQGIGELLDAKEIAHQRKHFDRDNYETERQKKIVDAAIEEKQKQTQQKKTEQRDIITPQPQKHDPDTEHLRKLDEQRAFEQKSDRQKDAFSKQQAQFYKRDELLKKIKELESLTKDPLSKDIEALKKTLRDMDRRIAEQNQALDKKMEDSRPELTQEDEVKKRTEDLRRRMQEKRDKDRGMEP